MSTSVAKFDTTLRSDAEQSSELLIGLGMVLVALTPLIDFVFGLLTQGLAAFGEDSVFRQLLKGPIFIVAIPALLRLPRRIAEALLIVGLALCAATLIRMSYSVAPIGGFDLKYLLKGPLLVLATFVLFFGAGMDTGRLCRVTMTTARAWFVFIALAIGLHVVTGIGLPTYEKFGGFKSFFPSQNVVTLMFAVAWTIGFLRAGAWLWWLSLLLGLPVAVALGTKAGVLFFAFVGAAALVRALRRANRSIASWFVVLAFGVAVYLAWNLELLVEILIYLGIGGERTIFFVEKYGIVSGLYSQRNVLAGAALAEFASMNPLLWLFGVGYENTAQLVGRLTGQAPHIIEIDAVDALIGGGLIGFLVYLGPILYTGWRLLRCYLSQRNALLYPPLVALSLFFIASLTSGHSAFSGTASIVQGVLLAVSWRLILVTEATAGRGAGPNRVESRNAIRS